MTFACEMRPLSSKCNWIITVSLVNSSKKTALSVLVSLSSNKRTNKQNKLVRTLEYIALDANFRKEVKMKGNSPKIFFNCGTAKKMEIYP